MKRWAVLTVLLYALALLVLTLPAMLIAFGNWGSHVVGLAEAFRTYASWGYWLWLGILVAGQFLLLLLPIHIAERRLPARRPLKTPVIVTAFFLANLCFAGVASLLCAIFREGGVVKDGGGTLFQYLNPFPLNQPDNGWHFIGGAVLTVIAFWIAWAFIFRRYAKSDDENSHVKRAARWLLRGSILELLVAVPSHVIVRRRDDCCAPIGTFWGIATGISVMLLCFGPGVFFLFVERCRKLKPKPADTDKRLGARTVLSGYNLKPLMNTPEKSKKKQSLLGVGLTLLIGGICVLHQAGNTETFYQNIHEEGSASWAVGLGWLLILGGCGLFLAGIAKHFDGRD